jgi:hypothetical protein
LKKERGMRMKTSTVIRRLWPTFLSVLFAVLLFPNIVPIHGVGMSLFFVALGVAVIWLSYFGIGQFIRRAVRQELEEQGKRPQ